MAARAELVSRAAERARVELALRQAARESLVGYSRAVTIPGAPVGDDPESWVFRPVETGLAKHHVLTMQAIERCIKQPYGRLMIFEPPGSAKSTYASVVAPTWAMGRSPGLQVLMTSYAARPIERHSKRARQIVASQRYRSIWNTGLVDGSRSAEQWGLDNGSQLYAAGLTGAITSVRCGLGIIDDPVAGRQEAHSQTVQQSTQDAYEDDFLTRLIPGASLIWIQTRWAESDPAGKILPERWAGESGLIRCRDGQEWEVLCIPAQCEADNEIERALGRKIGDYLWPEWFPPEHWEIYQGNRRTWEALYQQRPRPLTGSFFEEDSLLQDGKPIPLPQRIDTVYAVIDTAVKTGKEHDGCGVVFFGKTRHLSPPLTILDWDLKQIQGADLESWLPGVFRRLEQLATDCRARYGSVGVFIEDKASGSILLQQAQNRINTRPDECRGWKVHALPSAMTAMGKNERGLDVSGYVHAGQVKVSETAYNRTSVYKGSTRNHLMSQIMNFDPSVKDMGEDDLFDCFTYGVSIGLGNSEGF